MSNALKYDFFDDSVRMEKIGGHTVMLAPPSPVPNHASAAMNIGRILSNYLRGKACRVWQGNVDVVLSENDTFIPDVVVVCNPKIVYDGAINGAPDLVVEILSPSTSKRDRGVKKDAYERYGVKEYWIVSVAEKSIEVYLLDNGRYFLDNTYSVYPDYELARMTDDERAQVQMEFKTSIFDDLIISVEEVFEKVE